VLKQRGKILSIGNDSSLHEISNDNGVGVINLPYQNKKKNITVTEFINTLRLPLMGNHNKTDYVLIDERQYSSIFDA